MIIFQSERKRIRGTENCWQLERATLRNGSAEWRPYKWFASAGVALREAAQEEIRTHPAQTVTEALEAINQIAQKYEDEIDNAIARAESRLERLGQFG